MNLLSSAFPSSILWRTEILLLFKKEGMVMQKSGTMKVLLLISLFAFLGVLFGCAGMEYAPKRQIMYYHKELPAADRAVEAARNAGKDKECPAEFKAVEKMKNDAYEAYWACRTLEGIAMADKAASRANALCPKKAEAPRPAPVPVAPAPPPAPTVFLSASPAAIDQGQCATLSWSATNASSASIDQGIGNVDPSGSRQVCPGSTTPYTITAAGAGGSRTATKTVTVNPPPPPPPPPPKVVERLSLHINFDTAKADIRKTDQTELQKAIDFVKKYPNNKISIEGHTDHIGGEKYNQGLSERRAKAVKDYLVAHGVVSGERINTAGFGKSKPVADNSTQKGRFENRRVEILILSE